MREGFVDSAKSYRMPLIRTVTEDVTLSVHLSSATAIPKGVGMKSHYSSLQTNLI